MTRASSPGYGWVIVAAGALMTCVSMGAMFSLAVFLQPISVDTGWSRTGISTAMTINFLAMGFAAFAWGAISDRFGPQVVVLSGSVLLGLGLVLASRATSLAEFQLVFGLLVGAAAGAFYAPMMALASGWFEKNRSLAVALVSAGMGIAPLTVAPFARWLIDELRLAAGDAGDRHRRLDPADPRLAAGTPPAGGAGDEPARARRRDAGRRGAWRRA